MINMKSQYVIQQQIFKSDTEEAWRTISEPLDLCAAHEKLKLIEKEPEGNYRIFFDAPDLMTFGKECKEFKSVAN